jgi:hypothetical protein
LPIPKIIATTPKEKQPVRLPKFIPKLIVFLILLAGLIYLLFFSPVFLVKNVSLEGEGNELFKDDSEKLKGINIFYIRSQKLTLQWRQKEPALDQIKIVRGLPDTIKFNLTFKKPSLVWQSQGKGWEVSQSGWIFKEVSPPIQKDQLSGLETINDSFGAPIIEDTRNLPADLTKAIVSSDFVNFISTVWKELPNKIPFKMKKVTVGETTFQPEIYLDNGWRIKMDSLRQPMPQVEAAAKIINAHKDEIKEYIDTRIEGFVYYK